MSDDKIILFEEWKREHAVVQEPFETQPAEPMQVFEIVDTAIDKLRAIGLSTKQIERVFRFCARDVERDSGG